MRENRFIWEENEVTFITPNCKTCKYAIDFGIDGCELDVQTDSILAGEVECDKKEVK